MHGKGTTDDVKVKIYRGFGGDLLSSITANPFWNTGPGGAARMTGNYMK